MYMYPMDFSEFLYINSEMIIDISKKAIYELVTTSNINNLFKVFFLSIYYFAISTEMRLLEPKQGKNKDGLKQSELYHLKALEIVLKYIP